MLTEGGSQPKGTSSQNSCKQGLIFIVLAGKRTKQNMDSNSNFHTVLESTRNWTHSKATRSENITIKTMCPQHLPVCDSDIRESVVMNACVYSGCGVLVKQGFSFQWGTAEMRSCRHLHATFQYKTWNKRSLRVCCVSICVLLTFSHALSTLRTQHVCAFGEKLSAVLAVCGEVCLTWISRVSTRWCYLCCGQTHSVYTLLEFPWQKREMLHSLFGMIQILQEIKEGGNTATKT